MMQGYTLLHAAKGLKNHCFIHGLLLYCPLVGDETSYLFYCDFQNLPLCLY